MTFVEGLTADRPYISLARYDQFRILVNIFVIDEMRIFLDQLDYRQILNKALYHAVVKI
jgi:hypothetical protein